MSSLKKTIQINPALFSLSKTRKNRESVQREKKAAPLISPNQLKAQLLRRIKEHKNREFESNRKGKEFGKELGSKETANSNPTITNSNQGQDLGAYTDEFEESLNYLKSLSNRKEEMQRKTLKNYSSLFSSKREPSFLPRVDVDLPESLKEIVPTSTQPIHLNYKVDDSVPYGILKGGVKPTYRSFIKTQKNYGNITGVGPSVGMSLQLPSVESSSPSSRYEFLKEKIKEKQFDLQQKQEMDHVVMNQPLIQKPVSSEAMEKEKEKEKEKEANSFVSQVNVIHNTPIIDVQTNTENIAPATVSLLKNDTSFTVSNPKPFSKKFLKRTIRRKYTLGKSKLKKTVAILIKDRNTRKKVLNAHKELKRTTIHDVKKYLRDHNLIRAGSNTPNDVVRKIYETAMLAGDVTNYNKETLLHNLSRGTEVPL